MDENEILLPESEIGLQAHAAGPALPQVPITEAQGKPSAEVEMVRGRTAFARQSSGCFLPLALNEHITFLLKCLLTSSIFCITTAP